MKRSSKPRVAVELSKPLAHQLNMYALAASAAGVGLVAVAQPAEAKIIYTPAHLKVGLSVPIDLNHDGIVDFSLFRFGGFSNRGFGECQYLVLGGSTTACSSRRSTNAVMAYRGVAGAALHYGAKVNSRDQFFTREVRLGSVHYSRSSSNTSWIGSWMNGGQGVKNRYLGLKFKIKGKFHFGWARMTVKTTRNDFTAILTGYAYETIAGKGIVAGKTKGPDVTTVSPATLGHLAAGASAIPAWRVKQTAATTH